jgi:hypothetical protein
MRDPVAGMSALQWSITAMSDTTERLPRVRAANQPRAFAVIGEAVWWVTIVDATLVRHHQDEYDATLAARPAAERQRIEGTLAGLRFVRNRMGHEVDHVDFIRPDTSRTGTGDDRITAWTWNFLPEPALDSLPLRGRAWEMTRYRAYQAHLAGHTVGGVFARATAFLKLATANAAPVPDAGTPAVR